MTKTEKAMLLEKLEEYAVSYGYYLEQRKHEKDYDVDSLASVAHDMYIIQDVLDMLNIDYAEPRSIAITEGSQRYLDNHPIHVGASVKTPRFCTVTITEILDSKTAEFFGYTEPTHYNNPQWNIYGKSTGRNTMVFAGVRK